MFVNAEGEREIAKDNRRKGAMRCVHQVHIVRECPCDQEEMRGEKKGNQNL